MSEAETPPPGSRQTGSDRRGSDRRRVERRAAPPLWRRPWAFVAYGAAAGLAVVGVLTLLSGRREPGPPQDPPIVEHAPAQPEPKPAAVAAGSAPVEEAYGASGFERLMLEGPAAVGRRVRTVLYCEQARTFQVRPGVAAEAALAALVSNGRVPGAECKWGSAEDARREDFVLLVPPELAEQFASAPPVSDQFQRRRRVDAEVEWIGRSEALALRSAGLFRGLVP